MPQKSTIAKLDPRIREEADRAVREGRATIDEIVGIIKGMGGEVSRSAVGRFVKGAREQMEKYRQAQEVAKVWVAKLGEEPQGDVGRLLIEMLRTVSFQTLSQLGDGEEAPDAMELMLLAKAMDHMAKASKAGVEQQQKVDELMRVRLAKAAAAVEKTGKQEGWSAESVERLKRDFLGITDAPPAGAQ